MSIKEDEGVKVSSKLSDREKGLIYSMVDMMKDSPFIVKGVLQELDGILNKLSICPKCGGNILEENGSKCIECYA